MFNKQLTADGSFTFFSPEFAEKFHSHYGAASEAQKKFVEPCLLAQKASVKSQLFLLDICYGLGYNSAAALNTIWSVNPECQVHLMALEADPSVPIQAVSEGLLSQYQPPIPLWLAQLAHLHQVDESKFQAQLLIGDARQTIQLLSHKGFEADAIFLDPFSPPKCPQLWTVEFIALVAKCLHTEGRLATYSCAASVRSALAAAGLQFGPTTSVGRRSPGTVANFRADGLGVLSQQEKEHLQTRAAIPYRDPQLHDTLETIQQRRQTEQAASNLEPTSHWKKRWSRPDMTKVSQSQ